MLPEEHALSPAVIVATAKGVLSRNGFQIGTDTGSPLSAYSNHVLAEDPYSFICLVAYDSWSELERTWEDIQAELVGLFAQRLSRSSPKAWDGYLLLTCATAAPDQAAINVIERDTTRLRKILATGVTLRTTKEVAAILDPFLPLELAEADVGLVDVFSSLPELLQPDVPALATKTVVEAFQAMEPPLEKLHSLANKL